MPMLHKKKRATKLNKKQEKQVLKTIKKKKRRLNFFFFFFFLFLRLCWSIFSIYFFPFWLGSFFLFANCFSSTAFGFFICWCYLLVRTFFISTLCFFHPSYSQLFLLFLVHCTVTLISDSSSLKSNIFAVGWLLVF